MARRSRGRRGGRHGRGPNIPLLMGSALLVIGALGGAGWYMKSVSSQFETDQATGCLTQTETPEAVLFLVDATDKLSRPNAARITTHITDIVDRLPRYGRVIVIPFGENQAQPLQPILDLCVPGKGEAARPDEGAQILAKRYDEFKRTIDELGDDLTEVPDSNSSPISQQMVRAISDDVLHWNGRVRRLVLITDGLQTGRFRDASGELPAPPSPNFLKGVQAEYFEVGNERDVVQQTRELRQEWIDWFSDAGAEIEEVIAPGF